MSRYVRKTRLSQAAAICVTGGFLIAAGSVAVAQQPEISMFCKTSAGGPGLALVTLTNLTSSSIPKGQTLFAKKGGVTIQFQAAEEIPAGGSAIQRMSDAAFQVEGNCDGWH